MRSLATGFLAALALLLLSTPAFSQPAVAGIVRDASGAILPGATVTLIKALGGLKAIAISHPHFYTTLAEWSRAFGDVPVHLHAADQRWITELRPAEASLEERFLELTGGVVLEPVEVGS